MLQQIGIFSLLAFLGCLRPVTSGRILGPCSKVCTNYTGVFSIATKGIPCCPSVRTICTTITSQSVEPLTITITTTTTDESIIEDNYGDHTITTTETETTSDYLTTTELSTTTELATTTNLPTSDNMQVPREIGATTETDVVGSSGNAFFTSSGEPSRPTSPPDTMEYWNEYFDAHDPSTDDITQFYLARSIRVSRL